MPTYFTELLCTTYITEQASEARNFIIRSICIYNILHSYSFMQATEPHSNCSLKRDIFPMYPNTFCSFRTWSSEEMNGQKSRDMRGWRRFGQHYVKAPDWRYLSDLSGETPFGEKLNQLDPFHPYMYMYIHSHSIILTWHHLRFFHPERIRSYSRWISQIGTRHKVTHIETATSGDHCRAERGFFNTSNMCHFFIYLNAAKSEKNSK